MQDEKQREVMAWMKKAQDDLRTARVVMEVEPQLIESAMFHCQQAVEKAMKTFLTAHDTPFRKTHNLDELACACEKKDDTLKPIFDLARDLTVFAWEFRYPGDSETPPAEEAYDAIGQAQAVIKAVQSRLSEYFKET
jgi:HEPN domain-containing protein